MQSMHAYVQTQNMIVTVELPMELSEEQKEKRMTEHQ
jgi:hypothetical protein